jgi:hypothetical protein
MRREEVILATNKIGGIKTNHVDIKKVEGGWI